MKRRSIVFLNRYYWPDEAATSQLLTDLAQAMAGEGWAVRVVASRAAYRDSRADLPRAEEHAGVQITRILGPNFARFGLAGRAIDYLAYYAGSLAYLLVRRDWHIVVAMTDPPLLVVPASWVARLRGRRVIYWAQDVFPEVAAALGVLPSAGTAFRISSRLTRAALARCDAIVALGARMRSALVAAGAPAGRTTVIDNWVDTRQVRPVEPQANVYRAEHQLGDKFVVLYSGNAGRAHAFGGIIEATRRLVPESDLMFVFIASGPQLSLLQAATSGQSNVKFLAPVRRDSLHLSLSAADVSIVSENPQVTGLIVPSKIYGILASARPVLYVGPPDSDAAAIVRRHDCGVIVPDRGPEIAEALMQLKDDRARCRAMGARARGAAEGEYDRAKGIARWIGVAEHVASDAPLKASSGVAS